jgi:hypothetical protein
LRHVDDTLLALSNERAISIGINGQVNFEVPLVGQGKSVAEFYRERTGELITCLVRGDRVIVFKDNQAKGSFQVISDVEALPDNMQEVFQPLEIFHDGHGSLILVVREGSSAGESYLASYNIDTERMRSEKISQRHF